MNVREGVREMHPQEDDALFSYSSKYSCSSSKMQVSDEVFRYIFEYDHEDEKTYNDKNE